MCYRFRLVGGVIWEIPDKALDLGLDTAAMDRAEAMYKAEYLRAKGYNVAKKDINSWEFFWIY